MVFSKTGRLIKNKFRFIVGMDELECVNQYKYLGVICAKQSGSEAAVCEARL